MVSSAAKSVEAYLAELPADRRAVVSAVRDLVNAHLPGGYAETMAFGMIGWNVPLARYPVTYNQQPLAYVGLAAQKNNYALYLTCVYGDEKRETKLRTAATALGKKLDMGRSCLRFKRVDDLPLAAIGELIAEVSVDDLIARHETVHGTSKANARPRSSK